MGDSGAAAARVPAVLAALTAGHLPQARRMVADGLTEVTEPVARAELVRLRARLSTWSGPIDLDAWAELVAVAEQIVDRDRELAASMLCDAATLAAYTRQLPQAERLATRALELSRGEGTVGAWAATGLGIALGLTGRMEQARPLLARAQDLRDDDGGIVEAAALLLPSVLALVVQERYDAAVDAAAAFLAAARPLGAVGLLPLPLCLLAHAGWKAGRWEEARLAAAEALTLAQGTGEVALELYAGAMLALVAGGQGRESACLERVARTRELSDATGIGMFRVTAQMSLVHLALGLGRPQDALAPLAEVDRLMAGQRRAGMLNWHADHVDVLLELGRVDDARRICAVLEEEAPSSRWESAALLRCRGLLEPEAARAVEHLRASVEAFSWQPYEQARSRLRLAERLAELDPVAAREQADGARRAFVRLRAAGWAARAEALATAVSGAVTAAAPRPPAHQARSSEPAPHALEVRLLGDFAVLRGDAPVQVAVGAGAQAVKFVALRGGRCTVDELGEALWPGAEPGRGRARLRNVLSRLRRDGVHLEREGDHILLPPGTAVDVWQFLEESERALAAAGADALAAASSAVDRYRGELLPGDRYHDWTLGPRERLRTRYLQLLDRLAEECSAAGQLDEALAWYERALEVERYDEDHYVAMAELLVAHGRFGPANRVVRRALAMLDQLGVPPSPALSGLVSRVGA